MPEGPQMVFLKELAEQFAGQKLIRAEGTAKEIPFEKLKDCTLKEVRTFGKEILFCFPEFTVRIHLMLFGKYAINSEMNRVLKLGFEFEDGHINFYACECRFISEPIDNVYDWSVDVLNPSFNKETALKKLLKKPKELVCEALLDQHILAGVGNKIKNESLFQVQVHPESVVGAIPERELKKLIDACVKISENYLQWQHDGDVEPHWKVYKKTECPRDHIPLQKEKIGKSKRSCYFCDKCQVLYH